MNIKRLLAKFLFRPEYDRVREITENALNDFRLVPYLQAASTARLVDVLSEVDPRSVDMIMRQLQYVQIGTDQSSTETYRISVVKQSRNYYLTDPTVNFAISLWTGYAFSEQPNLSTDDKNAQAAWDEFFKADRNTPLFSERKLHHLSETELTDGELFFAVYASTVDGLATARLVATDEIKEIIYDPDDKSVPLYYKREFSSGMGDLNVLYYPDWSATPEQLARAHAKLPPDARLANLVRAETLDAPGTDVVMLHAAFNEVNGRGWPLVTTAIDWLGAYNNFLKDRAAVARAAASVVEKVKVKGGQRALDMVRAGIGTSLSGGTDSYEKNPPPVGGSLWFENDALSREWMNRPTNAGDAEKDGIALYTELCLGMGYYPHYGGRGDYYRLATATAMEGPMLKGFNRYANFWSSVWRDLYKIVIDFIQQYGSTTFTDAAQSVTVSSDRIIDLPSENIQQAAQALGDMHDRGLIDTAAAQGVAVTLLKTALENMGVQGVDEMFDPQPEKAEAGESRRPFREFNVSR